MAEPTDTGVLTLRRSPLAHLKEQMRAASTNGSGGVALSEWPFVTMVNVRVTPGSAAANRIEKCLGARLPRHSGSTTTSNPYTTMWLGPDEWLVLCQGDNADLTAELREALGGDPGAVVDVSANRTTLELRGPSARQVLEKGCPLDLHPRSFPPGKAVSTSVGPTPVLLWQADASPTYRLLPRASFADYLARWLLDAMAEFRQDHGMPQHP